MDLPVLVLFAVPYRGRVCRRIFVKFLVALLFQRLYAECSVLFLLVFLDFFLMRPLYLVLLPVLTLIVLVLLVLLVVGLL